MSTWVQCDLCDKWRRLPPGEEYENLPDKWFCSMNPDGLRNTCEKPQERMRQGAVEKARNAEEKIQRRYKMVKFFEERKLIRRLKSTLAGSWSQTARTCIQII